MSGSDSYGGCTCPIPTLTKLSTLNIIIIVVTVVRDDIDDDDDECFDDILKDTHEQCIAMV